MTGTIEQWHELYPSTVVCLSLRLLQALFLLRTFPFTLYFGSPNIPLRQPHTNYRYLQRNGEKKKLISEFVSRWLNYRNPVFRAILFFLQTVITQDPDNVPLVKPWWKDHTMFLLLQLRKETIVGISISVSFVVGPIDCQTGCISSLGTHNLYIALCDDRSSLSKLFLEDIKVKSWSNRKSFQATNGLALPLHILDNLYMPR